jgi:DivIVA domain-containing protein
MSMKQMFSAFAKYSQRADQMGNNYTAVAGYHRADDSSISPFTIRSRRFGKRLLLGLDPAEVMAFLDVVAGALENAQTRYIDIAAQMQLLKGDVRARTMTEAANPRLDMSHKTAAQAQHADAASPLATTLRSAALREVEVLLHEAQERAHAFIEAARERAEAMVREAEALKAQQNHEAEDIVTKARANAGSIVMAAQDQETAIRREVERLAESRLRFFDDIRATLDACHGWLATVDPRARVSSSGDLQESPECVGDRAV